MAVDVKDLFAAGAHFGHKTSRWHPKMSPYIHGVRSGVHIIDLNKTQALLARALSFIEETASQERPILLVGTKRQASDLIANSAKKVGMPYVSVRWFGGMLTNFKTMQERIKRLKDLQSRMDSGELASRYNKLEVQRFQEEIDNLEYNFGGIKDLGGLPGAMFVADVVTEHNAVKEANKLGVPVVAIVDTNADPEPIDFPIPANDDAIKTLELIISLIEGAIEQGRSGSKDKSAVAAQPVSEPKPEPVAAKSKPKTASQAKPKTASQAKPKTAASQPFKKAPAATKSKSGAKSGSSAKSTRKASR